MRKKTELSVSLGLSWNAQNPEPCLTHSNKFNDLLGQMTLRCTLMSPTNGKCQITGNTGCLCREPVESTEHFLLDCFLYDAERQELFNSISGGTLLKKIDKYNRHDLVNALLFGEMIHDSDRYEHNKLLFKNVQSFLIKTKRLCYKSKLQYTTNWQKVFSVHTDTLRCLFHLYQNHCLSAECCSLLRTATN